MIAAPVGVALSLVCVIAFGYAGPWLRYIQPVSNIQTE
jgi:hypothetical protein